MKEIMLPYVLICWLLFRFGVLAKTPKNYVTTVGIGIFLAYSLFAAHRLYSPVDLTGSTTVKAPHAVLSPTFGQHIDTVYVDHNQVVKKGDVLYTLKDDQVSGAIAEIKAAQNEVQKSIEAKKVEIAQAKRDYKRNANLDDHVSIQDLEASQDDVEIFKAELEVLKAKYDGLLAKEQTQQFELDRLTVTAPFDGMVTHIYIADGSRVGSLHLWKTDAKFVEVRMPDQAYRNLNKGQFSEFYLDAYPGEVFRARVHSIVDATGESQGSIIPTEQAVSTHVQRGAPSLGRTVILELDEQTMAMLPIGATGSAWISADKPYSALGFLDIIGAATVRLASAKSYLNAL
ncbi:HlyD family secretion protein [Paraferrimonas haliotis]|uniref:Multidrug transporter n=1 Tax=Paraferrimonas haliotis TaxID=2013866 RepID=A0AA37TWE0_9GAMM|nr:efflux RND transporter periplasmic adaptor subunit [Paraferrimonas haliotis]GLS82796.1 multidrug transporter [Paraferrimonas haliotis]